MAGDVTKLKFKRKFEWPDGVAKRGDTLEVEKWRADLLLEAGVAELAEDVPEREEQPKKEGVADGETKSKAARILNTSAMSKAKSKSK